MLSFIFIFLLSKHISTTYIKCDLNGGKYSRILIIEYPNSTTTSLTVYGFRTRYANKKLPIKDDDNLLMEDEYVVLSLDEARSNYKESIRDIENSNLPKDKQEIEINKLEIEINKLKNNLGTYFLVEQNRVILFLTLNIKRNITAGFNLENNKVYTDVQTIITHNKQYNLSTCCSVADDNCLKKARDNNLNYKIRLMCCLMVNVVVFAPLSAAAYFIASKKKRYLRM